MIVRLIQKGGASQPFELCKRHIGTQKAPPGSFLQQLSPSDGCDVCKVVKFLAPYRADSAVGSDHSKVSLLKAVARVDADKVIIRRARSQRQSRAIAAKKKRVISQPILRRQRAARTPKRTSKDKRLYYRTSPANDGLVFATVHMATKIGAIHHALHSAATWGELGKLMPRAEYRQLASVLMKSTCGGAVVDSSRPFAKEEIPEYEEGNYPEWLQSLMDEVLPAEILERYGEKTGTVNCDYWHIDESCESRIVAALRRRGYEVQKRTDLNFF